MTDDIKQRKLKLVNDIIDQVIDDTNDTLSYLNLIKLKEREESIRSRIKGLMTLQIKTEQQMIDIINYQNQLQIIQNMIKENINAKPSFTIEEKREAIAEDDAVFYDENAEMLFKNNEAVDELEKKLMKFDFGDDF